MFLFLINSLISITSGTFVSIKFALDLADGIGALPWIPY
jgi:hypothetical protein